MKLLVILLLVPLTAWAQPSRGTFPDAQSWLSLPEALAQTQTESRPALVFVEAPWCGPCLWMKRRVFPEVEPLLQRFARASLRFDDHDTQLRVDGRTQSPAAWARAYGIEATPGFVLLAPDGTVITRITHALSADAFAAVLAYVSTGAYRHVPFERYAAQVNQSF